MGQGSIQMIHGKSKRIKHIVRKMNLQIIVSWIIPFGEQDGLNLYFLLYFIILMNWLCCISFTSCLYLPNPFCLKALALVLVPSLYVSIISRPRESASGLDCGASALVMPNALTAASS